MDEPNTTQPSRIGTGLLWSGLMCMTLLVFIRAMIEHDAFPSWGSDPFAFSPPVIGLTPKWTLALSLGIVVSGIISMLGLILRRDRIGYLPSVCFAIGLGTISYHAINNFEAVLEGSNLVAIVVVLFVASQANVLPESQRIISAIVLSFSILIVFIGVYEVFVTHPMTMKNYEQHREVFLGARGWRPGSFEALAYERRLYQPEPIAWFGLTNVFASIAGMSAAGLITLAMIAWKQVETRKFAIVYLALALIACAGLVLTGAKGGFGAFVLGLVLINLVRTRFVRFADGRVIIATCSLVILGVILRGVIGERLSELSLLFRSQYMVGSMRMFFEHPILGVGPGAFQDHYALLKPALCPEDVASAHSLPFDLIAVLGLGGIALTILFCSIITRIKPNIEIQDSNAHSINHRLSVQLALLLIAIASVVSIRVGSPVMDISLLSVQTIASVGWGFGALFILNSKISTQSLRWAMMGSAAVLAMHSMIEVSAVWMVSGMLVALVIGSSATKQSTSRSRIPLLISLAAMVGMGVILAMQLPQMNRWQSELELGAGPAREIAMIRSKIDDLEFSTDSFVLKEEISRDLELLTGQRVGNSIDQMISTLNQAELGARNQASIHLMNAVELRPTHTPTRIAASEQLLWQASVLGSMDQSEPAQALWDRAVALLEDGVWDASGSSGLLWLSSVLQSRAGQFPLDPDRATWLDEAKRSLNEALARSPHNPHLALRLMDISLALSDESASIEWANQAIKLHELTRLDPLRGLSETDLIRVRDVIAGR